VTLSGKRFIDATGFRPLFGLEEIFTACAADAAQGFRRALGDLVGGLLPLSVRDLQREIDDRIARSRRASTSSATTRGASVRRWCARPCSPRSRSTSTTSRRDPRYRARPARRALLIANHAGQLPFDAAIDLDRDAARGGAAAPRARMAEYWVSELPWVSVYARAAAPLRERRHLSRKCSKPASACWCSRKACAA